jgi:hypothetical protein
MLREEALRASKRIFGRSGVPSAFVPGIDMGRTLGVEAAHAPW